jgi:DNA helicase II / ATP-dependent DNA helicase PcrA
MNIATGIEEFWQESGFDPNDSQREAILHVDGPLLLTAGPGSGKTRVLLWRTLNLIVFHGVDPAQIFLSTFTEKAAKQLQDGLRSLLGLVTNRTGKPYDLSRMSIGTVHSLSQRLLADRRFDPDGRRRRAPVLMDALAQYFRVYNRRYWQSLIEAGGYDDEEYAQRTINEYFTGNDSYSRHFAALNTIALFNRFSEENLDPASLNTDDDVLRSLLMMYQKYRDDLRTDGGVDRVDFSLLQKAAFDYFSEDAAATRVFSHVIIDEYQDTNAIQEKLFFRLAAGTGNICVVGDDDQALYRFRGATVENLVQFESRCESYLRKRPKRIDLSVNYRSRAKIVRFYTDFINRIDWEDESRPGLYHRIHDKEIQAHSTDDGPAVVISKKEKAEHVYREIAELIVNLKNAGTITDYNQAAILFPAMKSRGAKNTRVQGFSKAFEELGVPYYAPRAGRFLEVEEAQLVLGLFQRVFGQPSHRDRGDASAGFREFQNWMAGCRDRAAEAWTSDDNLASFLQDRAGDVQTSAADYSGLVKFCEAQRLPLDSPAQPGVTQSFSRCSAISLRAQKAFQSHRLNQLVKARHEAGDPVTIKYLINRATALDWTVLDLFYQLNGFDAFGQAYRDAESGTDEGPICNLGLITQYLSRYMDEYSPILTGQNLIEDRFVNQFFSSFLYALFRLGESEYEDAEDPFPKGRVPFLTIHQSKGLEFPVVVVGSVFRTEHDAPKIEEIVRGLTEKTGEPLDRISSFDTMRMFYVALSRAQNLLVLPRYTHGKAATPQFAQIFEEARIPEIERLDPVTLPPADDAVPELGRSYSYTGDYLLYQRCPRNYMIYRKYGFVPSRGQTMFFGSLVHETIEDIHHQVMREQQP